MSPVAIILLGIISAAPTTITVPPPEPVYGLVVDEKGQAVKGAEVFLCSHLNRADNVLWRGRSDARGGFRIDRTEGYVSGPIMTLDVATLSAYRPGSQLATLKMGKRTRSTEDEPVRLVLRPAANVTVRVLGPNGSPVAGAKVEVRSLPGLLVIPAKLSDQLGATTDADGRAVLTSFSSTDGLNLEVRAPGFGDQVVPDRHPVDGVTTLTLRPVGRLVGRVTADDPALARGVVVRGSTSAGLMSGDNKSTGIFEAVSDADGRFEVPALAAGRLYIQALQPAPDLYAVSQAGLRLQPPLDAGGRVEVEMKLRRGIPVRGVVRERGTGRPVAAATVHLKTEPASVYARVRSDANGRFEGRVGPGHVTFSLGYAGPLLSVNGTSPMSATLAEDSNGIDVGVIEVVEGIDVRGVVFDEGGKPVVGATVEAVTTAGRFVVHDSFISPALLSDQRGRFDLKGMEPGVALLLRARSGEAATGPPTPFMPGEGKEAKLVVSRANTISLGGRVLDLHGKPVVGASVQIESRLKSLGNARVSVVSLGSDGTRLKTDASGRFQTPRFLPAYAEHRAMVFGTGKAMGWTEWFAPTTPSLFDLYLQPYPPAGQEQIRANIDAGWAAFYRGDYVAAETRFEEALAEADKAKVVDPLTLSYWLAGLAEVRLELEKYEAAETLGRRVLALREGVLDANHPDVAEAKILIARAYEGRGESVQAVGLYREAALILERSAGADSPRFAVGLARVGICEARLGQLDQARTVLTRCVEIAERARGRDHGDISFMMYYLADVLNRLEKPDEAEAAYRKALAVDEAVNGVDHPGTLATIDALAGLLRKTGRIAEAEALEARAKASRARQAKPFRRDHADDFSIVN